MYVLGLYGGLGAGKSTAARVLAGLGAVVIDTDDVARHLVDEVPAVRDRIVGEFGESILRPNGRIDRAALAARAFASEEETARLDAIVHPAVIAAVAGALDALSVSEEPPAVVVLVVPLLVEVPEFLEFLDAVLAISVRDETRIERVIARGMTLEDAENRVGRQVGDAERRAIADYVIENDGTIEEFETALNQFWDTVIASREF